jgi:hypothetical protein
VREQPRKTIVHHHSETIIFGRDQEFAHIPILVGLQKCELSSRGDPSFFGRLLFKV